MSRIRCIRVGWGRGRGHRASSTGRHRASRTTWTSEPTRRRCHHCRDLASSPPSPAYSAPAQRPHNSAVFTCTGALGTPNRTGPLARKYLPGFPYSWSLGRLRQKISSIYCTVIYNYASAAQEQPFTVSLLCITKRVKLSWPDMHC